MTTPDTIARLTAEPAGEDVERVAKDCWRANMIRAAEARGSMLPATFDFEWGWNELASMPLSGPGFVDEWMTIARAAIAALHPTDDLRRTREAELKAALAAAATMLAHFTQAFELPAFDGSAHINKRFGKDTVQLALAAENQALAALSTVSKEPSA